MFPDVGAPCGVCAACDGVGRCTLTPGDDAGCGVIDCSGLDSPCRKYTDLGANRCATLGTCKQANDPAVCVIYTDKYAWVDASQVHRECATGRVMNCYRFGTRWVWQDGSVIKDCRTGELCAGCSLGQLEKPEEWTPPKDLDPDPP